MGVVKRAALHVGAVVKGMVFIGFTLQMILGICWMCCNFMQVQDFGEPGAFLYRGIFRLLWKNPCLMYLLQLALAFYAGYRFLWKLRLRLYSGGRFGGRHREKVFTAWGSMALLTFPFALQCHLAILPHSFMGSLFLLLLSYLTGGSALDHSELGLNGLRESSPSSASSGLRAVGGGRRRTLYSLLSAVICGGLIVALSGAADGDRRENAPKRNIQSALASRMAWPDIWNDRVFWRGDLAEIDEEVVWRTAYYPGNMDILLKVIEERVGEEAAKDCYMQIARTGWERHGFMVVRQIGEDMLGYAVTPLIFRLQLQGEFYDSLSGRNYEVMRGNAPVWTKYYVDYGCWWFGCCLVLTLCLACIRTFVAGAGGWKKWIMPGCICAAISIVLVCFLTMRGAGLMDYKYTIAVNQLWFMVTLLLINPGDGAYKHPDIKLEAWVGQDEEDMGL